MRLPPALRLAPAVHRAAARVRPLVAAAVAACADTPAAPSAATPPAPPPVQTPTAPLTPSSFARIDSALARGEIDSTDALVQRLYAARGDARLLERYRDPLVGAAAPAASRVGPVLREAAERFATLPPAVREAVAAYFQPPAYAGSAWAPAAAAAGARASRAAAPDDPTPGPGPIPQAGWTYVDAPNVPVRVWTHPEYSRGNVTAAQVVEVLQGTVWPKLTALMGRPPVSDAGGQAFEDANGVARRWGDGGSGAFDVYLIAPNRLGVPSGGAATLNYPPGCSARPSFMLLGSEFSGGTPLNAVLAHEFFHALQFAFPRSRTIRCAAPIDEGIAEWASYHTFPRWGPTAYTELLDYGGGSFISYQGYPFWPFVAYLAHAHSPELVRAIYERFATALLPEYAVDRALPGGLARHLPEFARHAWNGPESGSSFVAWEGLTAAPQEEYRVPREGGGYDVKARPIGTRRLALAAGEASHTWKEWGPMTNLTRAYLRYAPAGDDVRSLVFRNPHVGKRSPTMGVQALVKIAGRPWRAEDWTARPEVTFCHDDAAERLDSVIVIMANVSGEHDVSGAPRDFEVVARRACEGAYEVEARVVETLGKQTDPVWDVRYRATVDRLPAAGSQYHVVGAGTYEGFLRVRTEGDCRFGGGWRKVDVKGAADAGLSFAERDGRRGAFWQFTTLDWTWLFGERRHAASDAEREAAKGKGSRGGGLVFPDAGGTTYARADTTVTRPTSSDCPDGGESVRVVSVKITKVR